MTFVPLHFHQLENQCRDLYINDLFCKNKTIFAIAEKIKSPLMTVHEHQLQEEDINGIFASKNVISFARHNHGNGESRSNVSKLRFFPIEAKCSNDS